MESKYVFKRRCGIDPHELPEFKEGSLAVDGCPDVWELESGDYAVIGLSLIHI